MEFLRLRREQGQPQPIRSNPIDHQNMQSAQVNQMTVQLKDKIDQIQQFYALPKEQLTAILGEGFVSYNDLISTTDLDFWAHLCRKDFKRLVKLFQLSLGEGHFLDDSDSDKSSDNKDVDSGDDGMALGGRRNRVVQRRRGAAEDNKEDDEDEDEFSHDDFMEQMMKDMANQQNDDQDKEDDLRAQIREEDQRAEKERQSKEAEFGENQFWQTGETYDIDQLLEDYEA